MAIANWILMDFVCFKPTSSVTKLASFPLCLLSSPTHCGLEHPTSSFFLASFLLANSPKWPAMTLSQPSSSLGHEAMSRKWHFHAFSIWPCSCNRIDAANQNLAKKISWHWHSRKSQMFPGYRFIFVPAGYPGEAKPMLPIRHFYPKTSTARDLWEERALGRKARRKKTARNFWRGSASCGKGPFSRYRVGTKNSNTRAEKGKHESGNWKGKTVTENTQPARLVDALHAKSFAGGVSAYVIHVTASFCTGLVTGLVLRKRLKQTFDALSTHVERLGHLWKCLQGITTPLYCRLRGKSWNLIWLRAVSL